jgi:hypothetical protein
VSGLLQWASEVMERERYITGGKPASTSSFGCSTIEDFGVRKEWICHITTTITGGVEA